MTRERRYGGGDGRFQSPTPPGRLSRLPARFRDHGYSLSPRRRYNVDMEEDRRGGGYMEEERRRGGYSRRDYNSYEDKHFDRGGRDYGKNFSRGDIDSGRDCDRSLGRGGRDDDRSLGRGDRDNDRSCSRGDRGNGRSYSHRGRGGRVTNYNAGDRERDSDLGHSWSMYQSSGNGEYSRSMYQSRGNEEYPLSMNEPSGNVESTQSVYEGEGTSFKYQSDHLLDETKSFDGFKSSIDHGIGGSGVRSDLEYDYQRSKFFDKGRDGLKPDSKPVLIEAERGRDYSSSSYPMKVSFPTKSSTRVDAIGSGLSMSTPYSSSGHYKDEDFQFHGKLHLGKLVADEPLARESYVDKPLHYSSLDTDYMVSSSRFKAFDLMPLQSFKEDIPSSLRYNPSLPSDGVRMSHGMMTNYVSYEGSGEKSQTRSPMDHEGRFGDIKSYSESYLDNAEDNCKNYSYPQVGSSERGVTVPKSADSYGKMLGVGEDYSYQDTSRLGILDPIGDKVDESSHQGYLRESRQWDLHPSSLGQSISDHYDAHESFHSRRKDVDEQGYRSPQPEYQRVFYHGPGSSGRGELNHDHQVAGSPRFHHKQSNMLPAREYDSHLGGVVGRSQEKLMVRDESLSKPSKNGLKRTQAEMQFIELDSTSYDLGNVGEPRINNVDSNTSSKSLEVINSRYKKPRRALNMTACHQLPSDRISLSSASDSRKSHICGTRDIKKRLGPVAQKVHVSQRLVKKYKPSLKMRLGPGPQKNHVTLPWLKNLNAPKLPIIQEGSNGNGNQGEDSQPLAKKYKPSLKMRLGPGPQKNHVTLPWLKNLNAPKLPIIQEGSDGNGNRGEDSQEGNVTPAKHEPPENSQDFEKLVNNSFFKFVKQLNETPAKRRKYKEQAKAGSLKCLVCRSPEEFIGTESLAKHAFISQDVGCRSQHLGFHKALCALMGWKSTNEPNNTWLCEMLSEAENSSLKEDLILWPPVVIIHNSTIGNKNPDQRVIVTIEELDSKLKNMGFGYKTKVYRGKPANQSVMVVEFAGVLSSLQEAERLHKFYVDNNHGRDEFLQLGSCSNGSNGGEVNSATLNKVKDILYGYLGIAEDLDKLDFDAKNRRVVKSKKKIKDIAEASLDTP